ncbi:MAG: hypothetical protein PVI20_01835 [Desulfobacteraceae bacterium]|jgi:hypothetical protein
MSRPDPCSLTRKENEIQFILGESFGRTDRMGIIEVDLFPEDVNSLDHPKAVKFRKLLEAVADEYDCELLLFEVDHGTVSFSFDNDELTAEILKVLQNGNADL